MLLFGLIEDFKGQIEGASDNLVCGEAPILSERNSPRENFSVR